MIHLCETFLFCYFTHEETINTDALLETWLKPHSARSVLHCNTLLLFKLTLKVCRLCMRDGSTIYVNCWCLTKATPSSPRTLMYTCFLLNQVKSAERALKVAPRLCLQWQVGSPALSSSCCRLLAPPPSPVCTQWSSDLHMLQIAEDDVKMQTLALKFWSLRFHYSENSQGMLAR